MIQAIAIVTILAGAFLACCMLLVERLFVRHIKKESDRRNAELITWMMFRDTWSGKDNEILYAWRKVLYELKRTRHPEEQVAAAQRKVAYWEGKMTKAKRLVTPSGKITKITEKGGNHEAVRG